ncbi:MAG TPA: hypothetical protein DDW76_25145 [Cyanobacteria bacterium UBA11369]|nr:hypothetical protein [Cyanobacteria bacterium UBA11371]HBE51973.1 hypothetical protein [Cyanobacteria bacterium UBA11369]
MPTLQDDLLSDESDELLTDSGGTTPTTLNQTDAASQTRLVESYGKIPLSFEMNQGQTDAQVNYLSRGNGYAVFLTPTEAVLSLQKPTAKSSTTESSGDNQTATGSILRMQLVGANAASQATGIDELSTKSNYLKGNDPNHQLMGISNYAKVKYENIYSGIDVIYYGNQQQLEYDFVVAPGADPNAIALNFQGADKVEIDAQGDLVLQTAGGEVRFHKPVIYQEVSGERQEVSGDYVLKDNQQVGFQIGNYDASKPLIIDPVLSYSTYLGGSGIDSDFVKIAVDSAGNAYVTGRTTSPNFPKATGFNNGGSEIEDTTDVFVAKLNANGTQLLYSTYIGGSGSETPGGIAIDQDGNAYVAGSTYSEDFPAQNPDPDTRMGTGEMFLVKLNSTGSRVYSSILFKKEEDFINRAVGSPLDIAVDGAGNAYITGYTSYSGFPTVNPIQTSEQVNGIVDGFAIKVNAAGSDLIYSTFLGGNEYTKGTGITVDKDGNAYVTGFTVATNFPTLNAVQSTFGGGRTDAIVTKINPAGGLVYSTYLGGSGDENGDFDGDIAIDRDGNAYVTGKTNSTDFPKPKSEQPTLPNGQPDTSKEPQLPPTAFQPTFGGGDFDVFVAKLNPDGSKLVYSTYLGGSGRDEAGEIAVNTKGNAYVTGNTSFFTSLTDFPLKNSLKKTIAKDTDIGILDAFVTKLNLDGSDIVYSTLIGGDNTLESGYSIAVDKNDNAYVIGETFIASGLSPDFPIKPAENAIQTTFGGGISDAFVAKISEKRPVLIVPGIIGSFIKNKDVKRWNRNRGLSPDELQIDPLIKGYDPLIKTLENAGYTEGKDLFAAVYDWRLPPFPEDGGLDGKISGLSAASITDNTYQYGVDYLGFWLKTAAEEWKKNNGSYPDAVDVIAHSTGGLVTRSYIQSDAYGGAFPTSSDATSTDISFLPKIGNFLMLGVPNKGAPKAWNPINDDWDNDIIFGQFISKFANVPYQKVLKGEVINGPTPISLKTLEKAGQPGTPQHKQEFIEQYVPTIRALSPDYDFITNDTVPDSKKNNFLLDLNAGTGIASVMDNSDVTVIYGTNLETITSVTRKDQPDTQQFDEQPKPTIQSFTNFKSRVPEAVWYEDNKTNTDELTGDDTVPVSSSFEPFNSDKVQHKGFGNVGHTKLPSDRDVQEYILETLGVQLEDGKKVDSSSGLPDLLTLLRTIHFSIDPVEGFLIDSTGKRLGYSQATGPLNEIPNSVWFGDNEGFGWVFGSVDEPVKLELTGLGEDHYVQVSAQQENKVGGVESSGFLAKGQQRNFNIELTDNPSTGSTTDNPPISPGIDGRTSYTLVFDEPYYLAQHSDVKAAVEKRKFKNGFSHFVRHGEKEDRDFRVWVFDESYYLEQNPDVKAAVEKRKFRSGLRHFIRHGQFEGRLPNSFNPSAKRLLFDEDYYLEQNPDVKESVERRDFRTGFAHFIEWGQIEGRLPSPLGSNLLPG